ncbi:MAG: TIGR03936 family radical SAM-associated protein [Veillonellales bacterium]
MAKLRVKITKGEEVRYISHLDYAGAIERAIRRANLPAAYSAGFNPHMKLSFASALGLGVTSEGEYMDVEFTAAVDPVMARNKLNDSLPPGIFVKQSGYVDDRSPALMAVVNLAEYRILAPLAAGTEFCDVQASLRRFHSADEVNYIRESPKKKREIDLKQFLVQDIAAAAAGEAVRLSMAIKITPTGSVKAGEVLAALVAQFDLPVVQDSALIHRVGLYIANETVRSLPLP